MLIRPMEPEDALAAADLDRHCACPPWSAETFQFELRSEVGIYRVAESGGRLIGFGGAHAVVDEAHVTTLGVDPAHRRRGVGRQLLVSLLEEVIRRGCRRVTLEVREGNLAAVELYRQLGFDPVGRRKRYYSDPTEDALVLWVSDTTLRGALTAVPGRSHS